jgi:hypothetical protein
LTSSKGESTNERAPPATAAAAATRVKGEVSRGSAAASELEEEGLEEELEGLEEGLEEELEELEAKTPDSALSDAE